MRIRDVMMHFNVSEETARRDIKQLEHDGLVVRVHGGAVATQQPKLLDISSRTISEPAGKSAIAGIAVDLLKPGQNVFMGGGSTVLSLARRISPLPEMRIVTNMVDTAIAAAEGRRHHVVMLGGDFNGDFRTVTGFAALHTLREQQIDIAFIGVNAVHPTQGVFDHEEAGQALAATLSEQARKIIVLADHNKFGLSARYRVLKHSQISTIITDQKPVSDVMAALQSAGAEIVYPQNPS
ncbi:DeoR/GlpR family DNA-binding transcription regulator [Sinorhizobium psoraleae]|uniref:DeoR/GlpR family DNA-binding transcription regulator n=1 Tax=Sinorhizobium psoraleae TaxID=520838 RepID=A0ABT4KPC5_9HYPH|nr:DeoR/GlpR family DNA-binding transcription regulator [Sinorhizobium psoraleae]MCZ4093630.1 DeoR/GlpR family DNA-binding transcription regulator [Sinorhizobium psoraleae]